MTPELLLRALRKCSQKYGFACAYAHVFSGPESQRELAKRWNIDAEKHKRQMDKLEARLLERLNARCGTCRYSDAGWCVAPNSPVLIKTLLPKCFGCVLWRDRK